MIFTFDEIMDVLMKGATRLDGYIANYTFTAYWVGKMIRIDIKPRSKE